MISYGLRVLGGLAVAIVGILVLASTTDRMLGAGNATQVTSTTGIEINRTNKGDRTPREVSVRVQEQKRIAAVEVVGIRDAAIIYRDRDGRVLFSTDPLANVTVVVKNVALPEVTIRETPQSVVDVITFERARPAVPNTQPSEGCEPAVSAVTSPSLAGIASRCLTALEKKSDLASLN